eukprot:990028-Prymnesium_polylepis.2
MTCATPAARAATTAARIFAGRMSENAHGEPVKQQHDDELALADEHAPIVLTPAPAQRFQPSGFLDRLMSPAT